MLSRPYFYADEQMHSAAGMNLTKFLGRKDFGGGFTLVNQDGTLVSSHEYDEYYKLIYFGFTYCPDVCPSTLQKMATAIDHLDHDKARKVLPVFISVDPERDTPEVIRSYISLFHPRFVGFTGKKAQLDTVLKRYRVLAQNEADASGAGYQVNHTSFIYLTGPDDKVVGVFMTAQPAKDISLSIGKILD